MNGTRLMIIAVGSATLVGVLNATVAKLTATETGCGWERLPHALLCLAARRLRAELRQDRLAEWAGELHELLSRPHARSAIRLVHGIRYALGLLWVAPTIGREATNLKHSTRTWARPLPPVSIRDLWHSSERIPARRYRGASSFLAMQVCGRSRSNEFEPPRSPFTGCRL